MAEGKCNPHPLGCLLWTKIGRYPYWPAMVSYDPANGSFFKRVKGRKGEFEVYHVQYFGKNTQHGWTTGDSFVFDGIDKYLAKRSAAMNSAHTDSQRKRWKDKYHVPTAFKKSWDLAIKEAEKAMGYRIEDRHELFVFKYDVNYKKNLRAKAEKRKRKRRRHRITKPAKKKPVKVISEASTIVEPLCFYCEKGKVDLTCTSGVCTQSYHKECIGIVKAPDNFLCTYCLINETQPCIVCKAVGSGTKKCTKCTNYYHDYCLKLFKCGDIKKNICSAHHCWTCYLKNPRNGSSKSSLVTCFRCPTAFHDTVSCLPMGGVRLSPDQIVCPQHFMGKNKISPQPVNSVSSCSACFGHGELVCCESCPCAYHEKCIEGEIPLGDFFCDDCSSRKYLYIGQIVWAKSGYFRWWPALIINPVCLPRNIKAYHKYDGEIPIQFFGSDDYEWTHRGKVFPYTDINKNMKVKVIKANREDWVSFKVGLEEAAELHKELKLKHQNMSKDKPPHFGHIRANRAVPPAVIRKKPQSSCICSPSDANPCGPYSSCLNRTMLYECHQENCKAKNCQNQSFQKRQYAAIEVFKTENRGWGVKAQKFIPKGLFIIEYVGEVITHKEFEARAAQMRRKDSQNYYFLYLDKGRMIDAGPRGNISRFINHACKPNCIMEKWSVNGDLRIGIFSLTDIQRGEELTFNYQSEGVEFGQECLCGSPNCQGVIGRNARKKQRQN